MMPTAQDLEFINTCMALPPSSASAAGLLHNVIHGTASEQRVRDFWSMFYDNAEQWEIAFGVLLEYCRPEVTYAVLSAVESECQWRHKVSQMRDETIRALIADCSKIECGVHSWRAVLIRTFVGDETVLNEVGAMREYHTIRIAGLLGTPKSLEIVRRLLDSPQYDIQVQCALYLARNGCSDGVHVLQRDMVHTGLLRTHINSAVALANVENVIGCVYLLAMLEHCVDTAQRGLEPCGRSCLMAAVNEYYLKVDLSDDKWYEVIVCNVADVIRSEGENRLRRPGGDNAVVSSD